MNPITKNPTRATPVEWILLSARWVFVSVGVIALGYVAFATLDARLFQARAKHALDGQVQTQQEPGVSSPLAPAKEGDVLGRIDIPRLGLSVAILKGTSSRILRLGAGHIAGTALPGEPGNSGIAGHRDTFFRPLKDIQQNDQIQVQTATGVSRYQVDWFKIVGPRDIDVLAPSSESTLTLVTCYPFYYVGPAPKRFVVHAIKL